MLGKIQVPYRNSRTVNHTYQVVLLNPLVVLCQTEIQTQLVK